MKHTKRYTKYYIYGSFFTILFLCFSQTATRAQSISAGKIDTKQDNTLLSNTLLSDTSSPKNISKEDKKLKITSDSMVVEKASYIIKFSGNVVVTQQSGTIHAETITVILFNDEEKKARKKNEPQNIKEITASGNVEFISDNRTAYADQAVYTSLDDKLVLTGDSPKVITGESYVTGKTIILYQKSGKIIVEGDSVKRVEAMFNAKDDFKFEKSF